MKQMLIPIEPMTRMDNLSVDSTTYKQTDKQMNTWGITWGCTSVGTARGEGHLGLHSTACVPY
jgi:hypothetical protein